MTFKPNSMATFESFDDRVNELSNQYPTRKKAYQKTEAEHQKEFGRRRFRCYQTYKSSKHYHFYKKRKNNG